VCVHSFKANSAYYILSKKEDIVSSDFKFGSAAFAYVWNNISSTLRHKGARTNRLQRTKVGAERLLHEIPNWSTEIPRRIILQLLSYCHPHPSFQKEA